jgi:hypothetical protein
MTRPSLRALRLPAAVVTALAVVGSLALHLPAYLGLGILHEYFEAHPPVALPRAEVEFVVAPPRDGPLDEAAAPPEEASSAEAEESEVGPAEALEEVAEERVQARRRRRRAPPPPSPEPAPEPEPEPESVEATPAPSLPPPPAPPEPQERLAVEQRAQNREDPTDARFVAEEANTVDEETVARLRNQVDDAEVPDVGASPEAPTELPEEGTAEETVVEELREAEGLAERDATPEEALRERPEEAPEQTAPSRSPRPTHARAAEGGGRTGGDEADRRAAAGGGARARGGGARAPETMVITDGDGTFTIPIPPPAPEGSGEGDGGGDAVAGRGEGTAGEGRGAGRAGRGRSRRGGRGRSGDGAPNLRLSWTDFSSLYSEEELERERELYLEQRRTSLRGARRDRRWRRFRAALENYVFDVRPGNQTALNAAASPFAAYLARVHRRIHQRFADRFLRNLPSTVEAAYRRDPNMHTLLEIGIAENGTVERIGIVSTSGDVLFDLGAFNSVMDAQPFGVPPEAIRSPNGLTYFRWGFYRNQRQCGTFNARPVLLARAPPRRRPIDRGGVGDRPPDLEPEAPAAPATPEPPPVPEARAEDPLDVLRSPAGSDPGQAPPAPPQ